MACSHENSYHNGVHYECPDCDKTWGGNIDFSNDDDDEDDDEDW